MAEFAFNEAGTNLAYLVDADGKAGNGLYLTELAGGRTIPLTTGDYLYQGMAWNEAGTALAVLRGAKPEEMERRENVLLAFRGVAGSDHPVEAVSYDPSSDASFPEGFVVSEFYAPQWSEDGGRVFVGIKEQQ